jgi:predicted phage tail protein
MVTIRLHGEIAKEIQSEFKLNVKSVGEAMHAINILTKGKSNKYFVKNQRKAFKVLVNDKDLDVDPKLNDIDRPDLLEAVSHSELAIKRNIKTIDILPHFELHDSDILGIVLGALLIIVGVLVIAGTLGGGTLLGSALIVGGLGIMAAGVMNLLSKPPKFEDFREIGGGQKSSYLFNGPTNVIGEGGPVPVGYGELLVGSQTIAASYDIYNIPISDGASGSAAELEGKERSYAWAVGSTVNIDGWQGDPKVGNYPNLVLGYNTEITNYGDLISPGPLRLYQQVLMYNTATFSRQTNQTTYSTVIKFGLPSEYANQPIIIRLHFRGNANVQQEFDLRIDDDRGNNTFTDTIDLTGNANKGYIYQTTWTMDNNAYAKIVLGGNSPLCGVEVYK